MSNNSKGLIMFMPLIGGGGVEKNLFLISNYLSKKFKNIQICTNSKKSSKNFSSKIKFIRPNFKVPNKLNIRLKYLIGIFTLYKFLRKNKNYVVLSFQANIYCICLCKILNIDIIVRSNSSPSGWYHNFIKKFIYKKIISMASEVIVNSKEFKIQMQKRFGIKVKCIFNPLNKKEIISKSKVGKKDIFFKKNKKLKIINLGRFTEQKDQITILKAANILKNKIDFKLIIAGRGSERKNLINYINRFNLSKQVKIKNFQSNPYNLIKQSDIFILSSKYEGLPNVLLEAAVLKKYIISTDCPTGPKEILGNGKGGTLFKIGDYQDLAKKIEIFSKNKSKFNKKIIYTFTNLNKYDFKKNLETYKNLINKYIN